MNPWCSLNVILNCLVMINRLSQYVHQIASRWNGHKSDATETHKKHLKCILVHCDMHLSCAVVFKCHDQFGQRSLGANIFESSALVCNKSSVLNSASESLRLLR